MKTLYPPQQAAVDKFLAIHRAGFSTLDTSETGTGKTVTGSRLARLLDCPIGVVAPRATLTQWKRALEEEGVEPLFLLSYEKLGTGNTPWLSKKVIKVKKPSGAMGKRRFFEWSLPPGTVVYYDEVHRCANPQTGNAIGLVKLVTAGHRVHMMSATAAEDPTECRAIGLALNLHRDTKPTTWFQWMRKLGCSPDPFKKWSPRIKTRKLVEETVKPWLYANRANKIRREEMPDAFRENTIITELVDVPDVEKAYAGAGLTPEIVRAYVEDGITPSMEENFIVELLRARQLAEAAKVPVLGDMVEDLLREEKSVAVFLCFRDSIAALLDRFPDAGLVQGCENADEWAFREKSVSDFQSGESRLILVNVAAGGVGLDLHDTRGDRPRAMLISPQFSAKMLKQILGRGHRAGMQSDVIQKIVVAAGTVEETVEKAVAGKLKNLESLLG